MIRIEKPTAEHRQSWATMRHQLWDQLPLNEHLKDIDKMLNVKNRLGFIAIETGLGPIGFAEYSIRDYANSCQFIPVPFLEGIWVNRDQRRNRIAKQLVETIENELLLQGFKELCSDTHIENLTSQDAHVAWGFEETDRVVYFRKSLSKPLGK